MPVSFRIASDKDYRRGVVLGLTLAEVFLLLIFLLLLGAGAVLQRSQSRAEIALARVKEIEDKLQPTLEVLHRASGNAVTVDEFVAVIERAREADTLRSQLVAAAAREKAARSAADESAAAVLQLQRDKLAAQARLSEVQVELEEARRKLEQLASLTNGAVAAKAAAFDRVVEAVKSAGALNADRIDQLADNLIGQYRQSLGELKRLKGNGSGLPFCWTTSDGQPIYMLRFELRDDGFVARELPSRPRPTDPIWTSLSDLPRDVVIPQLALGRLASGLAADANNRQCRYAVEVLDRTSPANKAGYRKLNYLLDLVFARHEVNQ